MVGGVGRGEAALGGAQFADGFDYLHYGYFVMGFLIRGERTFLISLQGMKNPILEREWAQTLPRACC